MRKKLLNQNLLSALHREELQCKVRPPLATSSQSIIRVTNGIAHMGRPKEGPKRQQLLSLPSFPGYLLPGTSSSSSAHVTAISWLKYYFDDILSPVTQSHFRKGLVQIDCRDFNGSSGCYRGVRMSMRKVKHHEIMEVGAKLYVPVSIAESRISKRFDVIPSGTMYPNADEIQYLQRLVKYKDPAILVLNKPPKLPIKGNLPIHNSMDALAAAALSYDYDESPKLVHRLDRESSGLLLMGRTKESVSHLLRLFSDIKKSKPLSKILLNNGQTERVILARDSNLEASQEAITEYRVLGPNINGCSWIELCPHTSRKHQVS